MYNINTTYIQEEIFQLKGCMTPYNQMTESIMNSKILLVLEMIKNFLTCPARNLLVPEDITIR
jgi:hypothetical protein